MAHMSVEHDDNEKSVPKVAPGEVDDAVKQAIKSPPRRREIESAIESTSKTLRFVLFLDFAFKIKARFYATIIESERSKSSLR